MKKVIGFWLIFIFIACSKENTNFIESELQPYFDSFRTEASIRGIEVDFQEMGIDGYLRSLSSDGLKGQCLHDPEANSSIVIDLDFWNENNHYSKEYIVFHELGHCVLDRRHLDEENDEGNCISIMNSGSSTCRSLYNEVSRDLFLDELFSKN
jgi:hypothetical protein